MNIKVAIPSSLMRTVCTHCNSELEFSTAEVNKGYDQKEDCVFYHFGCPVCGRRVHVSRKTAEVETRPTQPAPFQQYSEELTAAMSTLRVLQKERDDLLAKIAIYEQQNPVAWRYRHSLNEQWQFGGAPKSLWECRPLYAHPIAMREPTDEECRKISDAYIMQLSKQSQTDASVGRAAWLAVKETMFPSSAKHTEKGKRK